MGFDLGPLSTDHRPTLACDVCRGPVGGDGLVAYLATTYDDVGPVLLACGTPCFNRAADRLWTAAPDGEGAVWGMHVAEYLGRLLAGMVTRPAAAGRDPTPGEADFYSGYHTVEPWEGTGLGGCGEQATGGGRGPARAPWYYNPSFDDVPF